MFGLRRRPKGQNTIEALHAAIVAASREPTLYVDGGLPDTIEGRFESLVLHLLLVLRRLRALPPPAADVSQELVDLAFAHLEVALRESGVGDFGVPKRMKKLATAFYDRVRPYDDALARRDAAALAEELGTRLARPPDTLADFAAHAIRCEEALAMSDLAAILGPLPFARRAAAGAAEAGSR